VRKIIEDGIPDLRFRQNPLKALRFPCPKNRHAPPDTAWKQTILQKVQFRVHSQQNPQSPDRPFQKSGCLYLLKLQGREEIPLFSKENSQITQIVGLVPMRGFKYLFYLKRYSIFR
jgi:hypothetical protein